MNCFHRFLLLVVIIASQTLCQQLGPFVDILRRSRTSRQTSWKMDEILPTDYNYLVSPSVNNTPVRVDVAVTVLSLRPIDHKSMSFSVETLFHQSWDDQRLRQPAGAEHNTKVRLNMSWRDRLWTPDTFFQSPMSNEIDSSVRFMISNQTRVVMSVRTSSEFICSTDSFKYPFDLQKCTFELSSLSNSVEIVTYNWKRFHLDQQIDNNMFHVSDLSLQKCVRIYEDVGTYSCLRANLTLMRNASNFICKRYLPSLLMVIIAFSTFWLPTTASIPRAGLSISSLFVLISQQTQEELSVSYMHAINVWIFVCIAFVFATLIEFSFAVCVTHDNNDDHNKSEDKTEEQSGHNESNQVQGETSDARPLTKLAEAVIKASCGHSGDNRIDMYSRIIFPVLFFIVIIVYSIVYIY